MRISDWSSDVCSSDLATPSRYCSSISKAWQGRRSERSPASPPISSQRKFTVSRRNWRDASRRQDPQPDRKSAVWGKGVSVRVDLGGRRVIQQNTYDDVSTQSNDCVLPISQITL